MPEDMTIARMCAPTLAGLKTGSLFNYHYADRNEMLKAIRRWNRRLAPKGVVLAGLKFQNGKALIYAFRPKQLQQDLSSEGAVQILKRYGYASEKKEVCLATLIRRISGGENFPHEIGLFLGYPPEDVKGFIEHRAENFKCVGYWKVYGDVSEAERKFAAYRRCTNWFVQRLNGGAPLERLTVAM